MAQNAGAHQGGVNKSRNKGADKARRKDQDGAGQTEAKPLDPGAGRDGRAPGEMTGGRR